jgi:hypothetical protein
MMTAQQEVLDADLRDAGRQIDREFHRLGGLTPSLDDQQKIAATAARLENLYQDLEMALPPPAPTEDPASYHVRLLTPLLKHAPQFSDVPPADLRRLALVGALDGAVGREIVRDAEATAADRSIGSFRHPGGLRTVTRTDAGGTRYVSYHGSCYSWMQHFMDPRITKVRSGLEPRRY